MHTEKEHILLCQHLDIFSDCERGILMHFVFYVKANVSLHFFTCILSRLTMKGWWPVLISFSPSANTPSLKSKTVMQSKYSFYSFFTIRDVKLNLRNFNLPQHNVTKGLIIIFSENNNKLLRKLYEWRARLWSLLTTQISKEECLFLFLNFIYPYFWERGLFKVVLTLWWKK